MQIDRMELADIGNPDKIADAVLTQIGEELRIPVAIDEIAGAAGITEIKALETESFEGALITPSTKQEGIILVNGNSQPRRRRFTIGHELGHFLNPWHMPTDDGFRCTKADMLATGGKGVHARQKMEAEANAFSAAILMPAKDFRQTLRKMKDPGLEHVVELATRYDMSKAATARRFVDLNDEPVAIVFSRDGKIEWTYPGKAFPFITLRWGQPVPAKVATATFRGQAGDCSNMDSVEASRWVGNLRSGAGLFEQVLIQSDGYRMTLLAVDESEADDDESEYERERSSWRPEFH